MAITATRRTIGISIAALALLGGSTGVAAAQSSASNTASHALSQSVVADDFSAKAYPCNITHTGGKHYAGYYSGVTVQPSSSSVTQAGKEAQCLLKYLGYNPGTVDGIFGKNSQEAAKDFQRKANSVCNAGLSVDGKVGPKTWPYLRSGNC